MPLENYFVCPLPNGLHARPASSMAEVSRGFAAEVILVNQRTGRAANCKSVLAIISADIRHDDPCRLTCSGADEQAAMAAMSAFVKNLLPHCDDTLPKVLTADGQSQLPRGLRGTKLTIHRGKPVVPGISQGRMVTIGGFKIPAALPMDGTTDPVAEWQLVEEALQKLEGFYDQRLGAAKRKIEVELLKTHRSIAGDLEFHQRLQDAVLQRKRTAAGAIADARAHFSAMLAGSDSPLLRERALDVQDVCLQLLRQFYGDAAGSPDIKLADDAIVVAESLTPGQFLALDRRFLKGLVLAQAGTTSHTVILARAFGIPTLTGVPGLAGARLDGQEAVVDADAGLLLVELDDSARRYYALERRRLAERQAYIRQIAAQPAATRDGCRIEIAANIASADEAVAVFADGAEGIGLFRTEMLFLHRESAPDENEQFEAYARVLAAAENRPVIIRTLDVGGDKPLDYLNLPAEANPFLGYRAVRIYAEFETLFRTQIRALVRASARGRLQVMIPMIATVEEARWVKKIVAAEQARCAAEGLAFDAAMPVGAMIEVPAAAFALDALCRELDFFSIGSNDLLQYFMAVDRANTRVAGLYDPLQPAFLRLLKQIVDSAQARKKWIGLCGEMGGQQPRFAPLLIGLGLDEISVAAPAIASLKAELAALTLADCRQLLASALNCATADEVKALLDTFAGRRHPPLFGPELVVTDADAATKAEAIKQAADRLYVLGRTQDSRAVEEAIWQREQTYSTGFGHGFAIPHCKTNAVQFNSLVLVKLRNPVAWGSLDNQPVRVVVLLAMRETDGATEHMKVFAKLARRLTDDDFRLRLERETDPAALGVFLKEQLAIQP